MNITKTITIDLARASSMPGVLAVEGDSGTRSVRIRLQSHFADWPVPEGVTASLVYKKSDGTAGWYDTLPDGSEACAIEGNIVTVELAPQLLAVTGHVIAAVVLRDAAGNQLTTFGFTVSVLSSPADAETSRDYYNLKVVASIADLAERLEALEQMELPTGSGIDVTGAQVGQTVKITAVDEKGVPTAWEAVNLQERTHYAEPVNRVFLAETTVTFEGGEAAVEGTDALDKSCTYTVVWDGAEYVCTPWQYEGMILIGNAALIGGADSGEPFFIVSMGGTLGVAPADDAADSVTLSIVERGEKITPLPEKYLPDVLKRYDIILAEGAYTVNGATYTCTHNYDAFADILYSGGDVRIDVGPLIAQSIDGAVGYVTPFFWVWHTGTLSIYGYFMSTSTEFRFENGSWTPPET